MKSEVLIATTIICDKCGTKICTILQTSNDSHELLTELLDDKTTLSRCSKCITIR